MTDNNQEPKLFETGLKDMSHWDKAIIGIAAILSLCAYAFFFMPSLGGAIDKVVNAPAPAAKMNTEPGEIMLDVYHPNVALTKAMEQQSAAKPAAPAGKK